MKIDKCPACTSSRIELTPPTSLMDRVQWELLHETFLCCKKCGAVYWPSIGHYFMLFIAVLCHNLVICAVFFVLDRLLHLPPIGILAPILGFLSARYVYAKCLVYSSWRKIVVKPGTPCAPSRVYSFSIFLCGSLVALTIVIGIIL